MKNYFKITLLLFSFSVFGFMPKKPINQNTEKKILDLVISVLQKTHFNPVKIDDNFSKAVFKEYVYLLDKDKIHFLQSDINEFSKYETKIDDQIKKNDLTFFYLTYDRLVKRMKESKEIYTNISKARFELFTNEIFKSNKFKYSLNEKEKKKNWLIFLKSLVIQFVVNNEQEFTKFKIEESEKKGREIAFNNIDSSDFNFENVSRTYFFDFFINAIVNQFDNHSKYITGNKRNNLELETTGKIVGIGIQLEDRNSFIGIKQLAYGGPAWKSKKIEAGDIILKIQDEKQDEVDVVGYDQEDIVKLIKGKVGSIVKLTLKKEDGTIIVVSIKRAVIEINDSYVKSAIAIKNNKKYGVIDIPIFYKDFDDKDARDAAKDVEKEIENLKKENVEGIVIDLRDNSGGSLDMSLQVAGYFLGDKPIVQVKNADKSIQILSTKEAKIIWDKPLVLMTNNDSASATEVFAAAIQDYKRGIILGSSQTFGKGTTQNTVDLNSYNPKKDEADFGILKTTIQKYYRINGGSTQLIGVKSDIVMPDKFWHYLYGEKNKKNILSWDKIETIAFKPIDNIINFNDVVNSSKLRIVNGKNFKLALEFEDFKFKSRDKSILINLDKYRIEQKNKENEQLRIINSRDFNNFSEFNATKAESLLFKKLPSLEEKRKQWHETLSKDIYVDEALNVLSDIKPK